ncbi:MAG: riboflavin synthase [Pseudomonadota bacterium]
MFTGIITDMGVVARISELPSGKLFRIKTAYEPESIDIGASIACSGVCLTVVNRGKDDDVPWFEVEAWEEALRLTNASRWNRGSMINLERAMKAGDEYGGHMVSGHVDGVAKIIDIKDEGDARRFFLQAPDDLSPFIAPKGSITLDGTSLTVNSVNDAVFDVLLIAHSQKVTTWGKVAIGDLINLEVDMLARYVKRYVDRLAQLEKQA